MPRLALAVVCATLAVATILAGQGGRASERLDAAVAAFWNAPDARAAEQVGQRLVETGAEVAVVRARLKAGRPYTTQPTGVQPLATTVGGVRLDNIVDIPAEYDPARAWPMRVQLHGGVSRPAPKAGEQGRPLTNRIPGPSQIYLHPRAWNGIEWWRGPQVDNIFNLVDLVKRKYNIDESRLYLTGISDGGTGVYFLAMRTATPWSACATMIGHPLVLANPRSGADQQLYFTNLATCPMYIVNGGRDPLYPADSVTPFVELMERAGASVEFRVHADGAHDTSWWPSERPRFEKYLAANLRNPHPDRLSWETDRVDRYNRIRWLIITALAVRPSDVDLEDVNRIANDLAPIFVRVRPSGRVDVVRTGNVFEARTRGVLEFTLLLSPDIVDFSRAVQVRVNGRPVFDGRVKEDLATLVRWAARDNDRTMLYGAELTVTVP